MKSDGKKQIWVGAVLFLIAGGLIFSIFSMLGRTDRKSYYLWETATERSGWSYEILSNGTVTRVEPVFPDEWTAYLPGAAVDAVRMSRTMTEDLRTFEDEIVAPIIVLEPYDTRVELMLDGKLLLSDLWEGERDENGFVRLSQRDREAMQQEYRKVTALLPEDYLGKTLTLIVYYAEPRQDPEPAYPTLTTEMASYASALTFSVSENVTLTVYAILTLLILAVFTLDIRNERPDWRMLLLALYFLLMFLDLAYRSTTSTVSVLYARINLSFLTDLYMVPLYLYLALLFSGWKRIVLSAAAVAWALFEGTQMFLRVHRGEILVTMGGNGLGAYLLLLLFAAAVLLEYFFHWRKSQKRRIPRLYLVLGAVVILLRLLSGPEKLESGETYLYTLVKSAVAIPPYSYYPVVNFATDVCAFMVVIVLVAEFIRRTIRARETVSVLEERSRMTLKGYDRVLRAEEATNAVRHEMRHHMVALSGLLREGDLPRAEEYVASLTQTMDALPSVRYSANLLVNVIAGAYLDRARAEGIQVEHSLNVPAELDIPDEDLSVFLSNMLENALQACQRLGAERPRYIRFRMNLHENALFISCVNSAETDRESSGRKEPDAGHGYGLVAMRRIAEKYDSILVIDRTAEEFSVKSNLNLKGSA